MRSIGGLNQRNIKKSMALSMRSLHTMEINVEEDNAGSAAG